MQQKRYELNVGQNFLTADFISYGTHGAIRKWIVFQKTDLPNLYNLAFGDKQSNEADFDDKVVTNNGDTSIVLATVAYAVDVFTRTHPHVWVYAKGGSAARNRLYQMGINKYFTEITTLFEILAETEDDWETYTKGKNYNAFIIRRKF